MALQGTIILRCLSLHSLAITRGHIPSFPPAACSVPCPKKKKKKKNQEQSLSTQEAGPVPPPLPQDPDKQPAEGGRGRASSLQDLKWQVGQVRAGVSVPTPGGAEAERS